MKNNQATANTENQELDARADQPAANTPNPETGLQPAAAQGDSAPAVIVETAANGKPVPVETMEGIVASIEQGKALGDIAKLEVGTVNLKTEYLSFEKPGEEIRRIFLGFTLRQSIDPATGEDKGLLPAAQLYDPTTETINICMQTVLVGVLYELKYPKGQALQITYKGDKKGKNNLKYQDFDIRALIPAAKK